MEGKEEEAEEAPRECQERVEQEAEDEVEALEREVVEDEESDSPLVEAAWADKGGEEEKTAPRLGQARQLGVWRARHACKVEREEMARPKYAPDAAHSMQI